MVQQVLYPLWDSGFKVGHSTRSIKDAIAQANRDMRTKTAMLESRFLAGDAELAREFGSNFVQSASRDMSGNTSKCACKISRAAQEIRRQRLSAGASREERMRRTARLSKIFFG